MNQNISTVTNIRKRPRWQLAQMLKRAGVTQWDIAQRAGVSQSLVSLAIARRTPASSPGTAAVWREIERVLGA
jgi:predicted transcriptional regulator